MRVVSFTPRPLCPRGSVPGANWIAVCRPRCRSACCNALQREIRSRGAFSSGRETRRLIKAMTHPPIPARVRISKVTYLVRFQPLTAASGYVLCLLACSTVQSGESLPTFQRCLLPPSSGRQIIAHHRLYVGGSEHFWNVDKLRPDHTVQQPRTRSSYYILI
jgi:hypothetical protein